MAFAARPEHDNADELAPHAEINVTPFIDVMLVLLIIFMVTAPMMATGMKVELPKAAAVKPIEQSKPVVVTIAADGMLQVGDRTVSKDDLVAAVRAALVSEDHLIQIRGDNGTMYGNVVAVMDTLSAAGLPKFVLAFERQKVEPK